MSKILEIVKKELLSWPYVTAEPHRFGGLEFRLNKREMGYIHGALLGNRVLKSVNAFLNKRLDSLLCIQSIDIIYKLAL